MKRHSGPGTRRSMAKNTNRKEHWKPVTGYEDRYLVSDLGNVWSLLLQKPVKPRIDKNGYCRVNLYKDGKHKTIRVHRLVADQFLTAMEGKTEINHINEDKTDNRAENLEYCTRKYNVNYGHRAEKHKQKVSKTVMQYSMSGKCVNKYSSAVQASLITQIGRSNISGCCRGDRKTAGGYMWRFCEE